MGGGGVGMGKGSAGWGGSKKFKPIPTQPRGVGQGKPAQGKARRGELSGAEKNCHP